MTGVINVILTKFRNIIRRNENAKSINYLSKMWYGPDSSTNAVTETDIQTILKQRFPDATDIRVEDVSGGCGAMFDIYVETSEFKGLSVVKQHRSVYDALKQQIKQIHGLHLVTKAPP